MWQMSLNILRNRLFFGAGAFVMASLFTIGQKIEIHQEEVDYFSSCGPLICCGKLPHLTSEQCQNLWLAKGGKGWLIYNRGLSRYTLLANKADDLIYFLNSWFEGSCLHRFNKNWDLSDWGNKGPELINRSNSKLRKNLLELLEAELADQAQKYKDDFAQLKPSVNRNTLAAISGNVIYLLNPATKESNTQIVAIKVEQSILDTLGDDRSNSQSGKEKSD
jgi:hypothetical protein